MARLSKLEPIVKEILEKDPQTREDDMYLYYEYIKKQVGCWNFDEVFYSEDFRKKHKISPYHSVARCRRRLQAAYEELGPAKEVQDARLNETADYIDYAIGGYQSSFMEFVDSQN